MVKKPDLLPPVIPAEARPDHAARSLARSLPDIVLESVRDVWGHTNVAVIKHWRDEVLSAQPAEARETPVEKPRVICLCGSTRFIEQFAIATWALELRGHIVLGCTLLPMWYCGVRDHFAEKIGVKGQRDAHHLRKIDLADEVLVLNFGGYIGESTRNEIAYAQANGKPVRYIADDPALLTEVALPAPDLAVTAPQAQEPHTYETRYGDSRECRHCQEPKAKHACPNQLAALTHTITALRAALLVLVEQMGKDAKAESEEADHWAIAFEKRSEALHRTLAQVHRYYATELQRLLEADA